MNPNSRKRMRHSVRFEMNLGKTIEMVSNSGDNPNQPLV